MDQMTLFEEQAMQPLAARLRPETLDEFYGQKHLIGKGYDTKNGARPLRRVAMMLRHTRALSQRLL